MPTFTIDSDNNITALAGRPADADQEFQAYIRIAGSADSTVVRQYIEKAEDSAALR